jgi:hypothetical protein
MKGRAIKERARRLLDDGSAHLASCMLYPFGATVLIGSPRTNTVERAVATQNKSSLVAAYRSETRKSQSEQIRAR